MHTKHFPLLHAIVLLVFVSTGCDDEQFVVPVDQNQGPSVVMVADPVCVPQDSEVLFDVSQTLDDRTGQGDLEFRMEWESDGTFDTPWLREPQFSHRYPLGSHDATVSARNEDFTVSTATCRVAVVQAEMPVAVGYEVTTFAAFRDDSNPTADRVHLEMNIDLVNHSDLWLNNISLDMRVIRFYSRQVIAAIPLVLTLGDSPWDHTIPPQGSVVLTAQRANPDAFLFEPPCDELVILDLGVSIFDCWGTSSFRTPGSEFTCFDDVLSPIGRPPAPADRTLQSPAVYSGYGPALDVPE